MNDELLNELKKQTKWLRFLALPNLIRVIKDNLQTEGQRAIYRLSDGENSSYEISRRLKKEGISLSHQTVHNSWKKWFALGIVIPSNEHVGRFTKIIDLKDLNIED